MSARCDCARCESLAGAIALGEATGLERQIYREHLAGCSVCLDRFGGERELERVAAVIATARESESWTPDVGAAARLGRRGGFRRLAVPLAIATLAIAVALPLHLERFVPSGPIAQHPAAPLAHHRVSPVRVAAAPVKAIVVVHHVDAAPEPAAIAVARVAESPPADRAAADEALRTVQTAPPQLEGRAESVAVEPAGAAAPVAAAPAIVRDAIPVGGEHAIVPRIPTIAYREGAQGTTVFEVAVDERGNPVKCTVTASSMYRALDKAVCDAAMRAKYEPKTIDGLAAPGIYKDAFTFLPEDDQ
jgi:TonB family protein